MSPKTLKLLSKAFSKELNVVVLLHLAKNPDKKFTREDLLNELGLPRAFIGSVNNAMVRLELAGLIKAENGAHSFSLDTSFRRALRDFLMAYATSE